MKVILFGATGMVGQGVLRECLLDSGVERVLAVGRRSSGRTHPKLAELSHSNFLDFSSVAPELTGYDAAFFCLGVSSAGMSEADYRRVTYDFALAAARTLAERNPGMTFVFVSGAGTDSTGRGRSMWARVKGETENALLALPFRAAYMFRPAFIQPQDGITSRTKAYRVFYAVLGPLFPALRALFPGFVTTTREVGRAMLEVAKHGAPKRVLENADIDALGRIP
jgi:uncharacterized protein YbjT (DUF2867 family)